MSQRLLNTKEPGTKLGDDSVNTFKLMNAFADEQSKTLIAIRKIQEAKIPLGKTFPMVMTLRLAQNRVMFMDFLDDSDTKGRPSDAYANAPYMRLRSLQIANDGPADINFSTNGTPIDSNGRGGAIKAGSQTSVSFEGFAVIESMTLALAGDATNDATIRVLGLA